MKREKAEKLIMDTVMKSLAHDDLKTITRIASRMTSKRVVEASIQKTMERLVKDCKNIEQAAQFCEQYVQNSASVVL